MCGYVFVCEYVICLVFDIFTSFVIDILEESNLPGFFLWEYIFCGYPSCSFVKINILLLFDLQILVIFCGTDEIRKQTMVGILNQIINKDSLHRVVLILQSKMNCHARKLVDEYSVKVETFQVSHFNIIPLMFVFTFLS